jgi:hypothetical protein
MNGVLVSDVRVCTMESTLAVSRSSVGIGVEVGGAAEALLSPDPQPPSARQPTAAAALPTITLLLMRMMHLTRWR